MGLLKCVYCGEFIQSQDKEEHHNEEHKNLMQVFLKPSHPDY